MRPDKAFIPLQSQPKERFRVLVVDDDPTALLWAQKALGKDGFTVQQAENGVQALQVFSDQPVDIVLLDVEMPVMNGIETCRELRKLPFGDTVPILMITGRDDKESIDQAFEAGATDFTFKPINWPILGRRIHYMLRASQALREAHESQAQLADAQRLARLGNWVWDIGNDQLRCSTEVHRIFGTTPESAKVGLNGLLEKVHPDDRALVNKRIQALISEQAPFSIEHRILIEGVETRFVHLNGKPVTDATGKVVHITGTVQDITRRREDEEKIRHLAYYDGLTGLINREAFKERLAQAITKAERSAKRVVVLYIDLDNFKRINDTLGHSMGDRLLATIAKRLKHILRSSDYLGTSSELDHKPDTGQQVDNVARLGGDEFTIMLTDIRALEDVTSVTKRILGVLSQPVVLASQEVKVTTSIGISAFPEDGRDVDTLLMNADAAMYHAKEGGKNDFCFYAHSMNERALERLNIENKLRKALERNEFALHYQPLFSVETGVLIGVEALLRWNNPELGAVSPGRFIPIAEETGLIVEIGEWVLHTACAEMSTWSASGFASLRLSVNLSPLQFRHRRLIDTLTRILHDTGMDPSRLDLEVTENVIMQNTEQCVEILNALRQMKLRLSVDDFGTGYSSLSYLKRLPINVLKVDRSFIKDIPWNRDDVAITQAIIAMAHNLGLEVVAEGVETKEQLAFLQEQGCEEAQGFLLARPQPAEAITQLLECQTDK